MFLVSCGNDTSKVTISQEEYNQLKGIKPIVPEYPKEIKVYDNWNNPTLSIIKLDDCEYITYWLGTKDGFMTHRGNCKFCQQRLEVTIRKIIQEKK